MTPMPATRRRTSRSSIAVFAVLALALYVFAGVTAELVVARSGAQDSPFQTLLASRRTPVDVAVIGASHALPLEFGDIPERLAAEAGQSMAVLAEVGAGPLYALLIARQALRDMPPRRVIYVLDDFAFFADDWNEQRLADRDTLRTMPWRVSTIRLLAGMVLHHKVSPWALIDHVTAFSKLNPPELFPQPGWAGAAGFDRTFRPSRHALTSRVAYLYPKGTPGASADRYLDVLDRMIREVRAAGAGFEILRLPVSAPFREVLAVNAEFETALAARLSALNVPVHDLRGTLGDPDMFFDTDHLNRAGVDAVYRSHLQGVLAGPVVGTAR